MGMNLSFNASTVAPNVAPQPVPTGQYIVMITKSEEKAAKSAEGASYLALTMTIQDGPEKGKTVTERLNLKNPSATAVEIAYSTLSAICHVTGVMQLQQSSAELHGKPFMVDVVCAPRDDDPSKMSNDIRGYLDLNGNQPGAPAGQTQQADPNQQAAFNQGQQQQFQPDPNQNQGFQQQTQQNFQQPDPNQNQGFQGQQAQGQQQQFQQPDPNQGGAPANNGNGAPPNWAT